MQAVRGDVEGVRADSEPAWTGAVPAPPDDRPVVLGFVIPTVGRMPALRRSLQSLEACALAGVPLHVVVVAQGPVSLDVSEFAALSIALHEDDGRGASRARNLGLRLLHGTGVTHVVWPNDHTQYEPTALRAVVREAQHNDVVVGVLEEQGGPRYTLPRHGTPLDRSSVWAAIEPASATSLSAVRRVGGWREDLGTGSPAPWQSSAFADLLLRMVSAHGGTLRVSWTPDFCCTGEGFVRGASPPALRRKARTYGRGYGRVLRIWRYPTWRLAGTVLKPLTQPGFAIGPDVLPYAARCQLALGRLEGVVGRVLPTSRVDLRDRDDLGR